MPQKPHHSLVFPVLLTLGVLGVVLLVAWTPPGVQLENVTLDWRFRARAASDPPADPRILGVAIDESGLEQWGRWPWPREIHAASFAFSRNGPGTSSRSISCSPRPIATRLKMQNLARNCSRYPGAITGASADRTLVAKEVFMLRTLAIPKAIKAVRAILVPLLATIPLCFPSRYRGQFPDRLRQHGSGTGRHSPGIAARRPLRQALVSQLGPSDGSGHGRRGCGFRGGGNRAPADGEDGGACHQNSDRLVRLSADQLSRFRRV